MRWMVGTALLALLGCGSGGMPGDALAGTEWDLTEGISCFGAVSFDNDHGYKMVPRACDSGDGVTFDTMGEYGTYAIEGDQLLTTPTQTTCPSTTTPDSVRFVETPSSLAIYLPTGILAFERNTSTSSGGNIIIRYGCFDGQGNFTPGSLVSL